MLRPSLLSARLVSCTVALCAVTCASASAAGPSISIKAATSYAVDDPIVITVTGVKEEGQLPFVSVEPPSDLHSCPTVAPPSTGSITGPFEAPSGPGDFETIYEYTPSELGAYHVCGYLDTSLADAAAAVSSTAFTAQRPSGSLMIGAPEHGTEGESVTIVASGTTNVAADLAVGAFPGGICDPMGAHPWVGEPLGPVGEYRIYRQPEPVGPGAFSKSYTYTASSPSVSFLTVCGALTSGGGLPETFAGGEARITFETRQEAQAKAEALAKGREQAKRAAEEAARRAAALSHTVARLSVHSVNHYGTSAASPGYTDLVVTTSPYAHVTIGLARRGRTSYRREWGPDPTALGLTIKWSCARPGGVYRYTVSARTNVGKTLVRQGTFAPVSAGQCAALRNRSKHPGHGPL